MPRFQPLSPERVAELTRRAGGGVVDLSDQKDWINQALRDGQGWGSIAIDPADNVRALKRRTTIAGKELGKTIRWHRKSTVEELIFQAVEPNQVVRRSRRARTQPDPIPQRRRNRKAS
jgi:hypothetical protein